MPDPYMSQIDRASELHEHLLSRSGVRGSSSSPTSSSSKFDRALRHDRELRFLGQSSPKRSHKKERSKYYGVRFRPDLQKWVAEIRVAEWKSVDKKVWLGTFDTQVGSARAVDVARKLFNCKKRRAFNCPCPKLEAYFETIPSHLDLNHLDNVAMFKEVTRFVKRKAQEYATSFVTTNPNDCFPVVPMTRSFSWATHNRNMEEDFSFDFETSCGDSNFLPSCGDSNLLPSSGDSNFLPLCGDGNSCGDGNPCGDSNFLSLCEDSNISSYEALPTSSSGRICISKFEDEEALWGNLYNDSFASQATCHSMDFIKREDEPMVECEARNMKSRLSCDDLRSFFLREFGDDKLSSEKLLMGSEHLIHDDMQLFCAQEHASMDIYSKDEMTYKIQQVFNI